MNFWERDNYGNQNTNYGNQNTGLGDRSTEPGGQNVNNEQDIKKKFEEYSAKSEDQLMNELSSIAARMKREGTFDKAALENMYNTASPFLNDMQRQRMRQLINMLAE